MKARWWWSLVFVCCLAAVTSVRAGTCTGGYCQNGGTCYDQPSYTSWPATCACPAGFAGAQCEVRSVSPFCPTGMQGYRATLSTSVAGTATAFAMGCSGTAATMPAGTDFTISMWYRASERPTVDQILMQTAVSLGTSIRVIWGATDLVFIFGGTTASAPASVMTNAVNRWLHLAVTFRRPAGSNFLDVYADGALQFTIAGDTASVAAPVCTRFGGPGGDYGMTTMFFPSIDAAAIAVLYRGGFTQVPYMNFNYNMSFSGALATNTILSYNQGVSPLLPLSNAIASISNEQAWRTNCSCASNPCLNSGGCSDWPGTDPFGASFYNCSCPAGYTGYNCQTDTNECASIPCQNGGTCTDGASSYTCACTGGFSGLYCQTDIDECASTPCANGGTCADTSNGFTCACVAGYSGTRCQTNINECASTPCANGGTCTDSNNNGYTCACVVGFSGLQCQTNVNECSSTPCANGGTCADSNNGYICTCVAGFSGSQCQTNINECASTPCRNGGTCADTTNGYTCTCVLGYSGTSCATNIDECASNPCQNNGVCVDGTSGFTCQCPTGFSGTLCLTDVNECASSPCRNGGTCVDFSGFYRCNCTLGTTGVNCESAPCASAPCSSGGTCHAFSNCSTIASPNSDAGTARDNSATIVWSYFAIFAGGAVNASVDTTNDVSAIDTRTGAWHSLPRLSHSRHSCCGGAISGTGMLFVAGGTNATTTTMTSVEYYNIVSGGTWQLTTPMTSGGSGAMVCTVAEGNFYAIRRQSAGSSVLVMQYNGTTGTAGSTTTIGTSTTSPALATIGRNIYLALNDHNLVVFDTRTLLTTTLVGVVPQQSGAFARFPYVANVGNILILMRQAITAQQSYSSRDVWLYDTVTGAGVAMNKTYASSDPCFAASDTALFVVGGQTFNAVGATGFTQLSSQYQLSSGAWTTGPNITTPVAGCMMAYVPATDTFVRHGGSTGGNERVRDVELFRGSPFVYSAGGDICSPYRTCSCPPGYSGDSCQTDIDECASIPCANGGTCSDSNNGFTCACVAGFSGGSCQTNINECASTPCRNGATCVDAAGSFSCTCAAGFSGVTCQTDINECASTPCANGGTCHDSSNGYTCTCVTSYSGVRCQTNIDECASTPCANGGTCTDDIGSYSCACPPGSSGIYCQTNLNECASLPCRNGATCMDGLNAYFCQCDSSHTGVQCQTLLMACGSSPCQNSASCEDLLNNEFACHCAPGFQGTLCETNINECASGPCVNGGTCADADDRYVCQCVAGYSGQRCQTEINECASTPCRNGGTCTDNLNSVSCACRPGFSGSFCQTNVDECASLPCRNGGTCIDADAGYVCTCVTGYSGLSCATDINECASLPCRNGGTCTDHVGSVSCACVSGYSGGACQTDINECASAPCANGGTCSDLIAAFVCTCPSYTHGDFCEHAPCASFPCQNGGNCSTVVTNTPCGSYHTTGVMPEDRARMGATSINGTGLVMVAGGHVHGTVAVDWVRYYNVSAATWLQRNDTLSRARYGIGATSTRLYGGLAFFAGGVGGSTIVDMYNASAVQHWSQLPVLSRGRVDPSCGMTLSGLLVIGGSRGLQTTPSALGDTLDVYNFSSPTGVVRNYSIDVPTYKFKVMAVLRNRVYLAAPWGETDEPTQNVHVYDTSNSTWWIMQSVLSGFVQLAPTVAISGHSLIVIGGGADGSYADIYNDETDTWSNAIVPNAGNPQTAAGCAVTTDDDKVFYGTTITPTLDLVRVYDPIYRNFSLADRLSIARRSSACASADGRAVFFGGVNPTVLGNVDVYRTSGPTTCEYGPRCQCSSGFIGEWCQDDINECSTGNGGCGSAAICLNTFGGVTCIACTPGQYGIGCAPCDVGTFSNALSSETCTDCQPGRYQHESGHSACIDCDVNYFTADFGSSGCTVCANGTFNSDGGGSSCATCSSGRAGYACQDDIDECLSNPCQNGETCVNADDAFLCTAVPTDASASSTADDASSSSTAEELLQMASSSSAADSAVDVAVPADEYRAGAEIDAPTIITLSAVAISVVATALTLVNATVSALGASSASVASASGLVGSVGYVSHPTRHGMSTGRDMGGDARIQL